MKHLALWYTFFTVSLGLVVFASRQAYTLQATPQMATFIVNSTADAIDANPGNGVCATNGGVCTLRAAIQETNALPGVDTITVPAGMYLLTIAGTGEDESATGDLDITDSLIINGADPNTAIIDGSALDHVFHVRTNQAVTLTGMTIQNGNAPYMDGILDGGGGIRATNGPQLTISNCHIRNNNSVARGGGIFSVVSALNIFDSQIMDNISQGSGGGISSAVSGAVINISNTQLINNSATGGGGIYINGNNVNLTIAGSHLMENISSVYDGGGIANYSNNSSITLSDTEFLGNTADRSGGAFWNLGDNSSITISNTEFFSNTANSAGGAFLNYGDNVVSTMTGSTFVDNAAQWSAFYIYALTNTVRIADSYFGQNHSDAYGGAIHLYGPGPTVTTTGVTAHITGTTFEGNTAVSGGGALRSGIGTITSIINTAFISNTGGNGGAIHIDADGSTGFSSGEIVNSTFSGNQATLSGGGYLWL